MEILKGKYPASLKKESFIPKAEWIVTKRKRRNGRILDRTTSKKDVAVKDSVCQAEQNGISKEGNIILKKCSLSLTMYSVSGLEKVHVLKLHRCP